MVAELDPNYAAFLAELKEAGAPPITAGTVEDARAANTAFLESMRTRLVDVASVEDITIPTRADRLDARVYTPHGDPSSVVTYFHGGGWVLGDLNGHDQICRQVADTANSVVVNVNYRHAPETPFPGAAEDAADAVAWAAATYSLPIITMGDSAGGNLAASATISARNTGVEVALQVLLYPVLDADLTRDSYRRNGEGFLLTAADMEWFWSHYVQSADRFDPRVSVLRVGDMTGLAPAVIVLAGFDPLRDEGVAYARRFDEVGTPCELIEYPGAIHGFMTLTALGPLADEATEAVATSIRRYVESRTSITPALAKGKS